MVAPIVPSGLCSLVPKVWMHCFSLATVGSPHCSLKLAVVLWKWCEGKQREKRGKIVLDLMYSSGGKIKLGKAKNHDTARSLPLRSPVICCLPCELNQYGTHCCL